MDDYRGEIQEHPFSMLKALGMPQRDFTAFEGFHNVIRNGTNMALGVSMRDNEIVGHTGEFSDVENNGINSLLIIGCVPSEESNTFWLQSSLNLFHPAICGARALLLHPQNTA